MIGYCEDCIYWEKKQPEIDMRGNCHRYPPVGDSNWVITTIKGWCGEYVSEDKIDK